MNYFDFNANLLVSHKFPVVPCLQLQWNPPVSLSLTQRPEFKHGADMHGSKNNRGYFPLETVVIYEIICKHCIAII